MHAKEADEDEDEEEGDEGEQADNRRCLVHVPFNSCSLFAEHSNQLSKLSSMVARLQARPINQSDITIS